MKTMGYKMNKKQELELGWFVSSMMQEGLSSTQIKEAVHAWQLSGESVYVFALLYSEGMSAEQVSGAVERFKHNKQNTVNSPEFF